MKTVLWLDVLASGPSEAMAIDCWWLDPNLYLVLYLLLYNCPHHKQLVGLQDARVWLRNSRNFDTTLSEQKNPYHI